MYIYKGASKGNVAYVFPYFIPSIIIFMSDLIATEARKHRFKTDQDIPLYVCDSNIHCAFRWLTNE